MEALTQVREREEEARRLHEQKCEKAAEAETMFNGPIMDTLEKAEALEKHVKTATMTTESLPTETFSRRFSSAKKKHRNT